MYIEDQHFKRVYDVTDVGLRDAMDLFYLNGQMSGDTLRMDERDLRGGQLYVTQSKTGARSSGSWQWCSNALRLERRDTRFGRRSSL